MTTTRISTGPDLRKSHFSLNGNIQENIPGRIKDVVIIAQLRARLAGQNLVYPRLSIESVNMFPTAAGLASSASGLAALAFGLAKLYGLEKDVFSLARRGSGSACRSLNGGFVHWISSDSTSGHPHSKTQSIYSSVDCLYPASHWPSLKVLICVTSNRTKAIGSTNAMQRTVKTSRLFQRVRLESVSENERILLAALRDKNFALFGQIAMRESNQLHALCLDTWPPCVYLTDASLSTINWVHAVNQHFGKTIVAYTFDAGPNAFLFVEEPHVSLILSLLVICFGSSPKQAEFSSTLFEDQSGNLLCVSDPESGVRKQIPFRGIKYPDYPTPIDADLLTVLPKNEGGILHIISTEIGEGPRVCHPNLI